ncbi:MAG: 2-isopropylmalate synthase [Acidobacteria bacterium]|nr:2-isopropylmalate synthase [Acidobacteriota bacterium]
MDTVRIFDTTLRDGEQSPGFSMNTEQKLRLARQIEQLGVDIIEAGFPIASRGDLEAVRAVAGAVRGSRVAALARAKQADVDAALEALAPAAQPRLHVFLATSDLHLHHKLRITRAEALDAIRTMVHLGRRRCPEVEFSAEDASRSDIEFLCEACAAAVEAGATILNLPDTVGYAVPEEYAQMFRRVREHIGDAPGITLSAHCHNDLGMAVANSLAAIEAGARQVECTINGIGERAGNASLEEIAVALAVRQQKYGVRTGLRLDQIYASSRLLSTIVNVPVPPNKAVVGANAFAHEAGIHQDGILKNPLTYEIISPEVVGIPARKLVLGKHSGRNAVRFRLKELGYDVTEIELNECYSTMIALADQARQISDRELLSTVLNVRRRHAAVAGIAQQAPAAT